MALVQYVLDVWTCGIHARLPFRPLLANILCPPARDGGGVTETKYIVMHPALEMDRPEEN